MLESTLNPRNNGFFREGALLAYILVSDEPEQSGDSVNDYVGDLLNFKNNVSNLLKVYSIHRMFGDDRDKRYQDIATATKGFTANIRDDFYKSLRDIGGTILNLLNSFILTKTPADSSQIRVVIDDVNVESGWSYSSQANSIVFDENAVPREGAEIKVIYDYEVQ